MTLTVNGKADDAGGATTVAGLLAARAIDPLHVVVEVNHVIVPKEAFAATPLADGDTVEILRFVGGG